MASFYAELRVNGHTYPVRTCTYDFTQATDARGRVVAKVRHGRVQLTLDVPDDDFLLAWAAAPYKPLAGYVVFYQDQAQQALETLSWEAGHCVGYQEEFVSGDANAGAYVCHVTIVAPQLTLRPGGPGVYVPPAPGEHGQPGQAAFLGQPSIGPEVLTPFVPIAADALLTGAAGVLAPLVAAAAAGALGVAAVLGLILLSTTPAHAPGRPVPVVSPDELRLRELVAKHAAGSLTPAEEAELIALLAKVKGIHVQKLSDLPALYAFHTFNGHHPNLRSCPIEIPSSATILEQHKSDYDQVKFKWSDGTKGYEARWHTRTPGAPAAQGDTWVITRTTPGTAQGQRKAQHILTGPNQWTPSHQWQSAVSASQAGTATAAQQQLLNSGHWAAK